MTKLLEWTTIRVDRRRFVHRVTTLTFGIFAGLAAGVPEVAYAGDCTRPLCSPCNCSGTQCVSCGGTYCQNSPPGGCQDNRRCWFSGTHECCDCDCRSGSFWFTCSCHVA